MAEIGYNQESSSLERKKWRRNRKQGDVWVDNIKFELYFEIALFSPGNEMSKNPISSLFFIFMI